MQLATFNIATAKKPPGSGEMAVFESMLDAVHALAERSPGFVWRMKTEDGSLLLDERSRDLLNVAVFEDVAALRDFTFNTIHKKAMHRSEGLFKHPEIYHVMWWVPDGHQPSIDECYRRLEILQTEGPSVRAFGWDEIFQPSEAMLRRERRKKQATIWRETNRVKPTDRRKRDFIRAGSVTIDNGTEPADKDLGEFIHDHCTGEYFVKRMLDSMGWNRTQVWTDVYYFELEEDAVAFRMKLDAKENAEFDAD